MYTITATIEADRLNVEYLIELLKKRRYKLDEMSIKKPMKAVQRLEWNRITRLIGELNNAEYGDREV